MFSYGFSYGGRADNKGRLFSVFQSVSGNYKTGMQTSQLLPLLRPLTWVYSTGVSLRNWLYDLGVLKTTSVSLPVICAGNATTGGSAKSPFVDFLCTRLLEMNRRPVILLRGYGGKNTGPKLVNANDTPTDVGDEALMHRFLLGPGVPVVVARNRALGAAFIDYQTLGDVVVLDDGYQHRRLNRDLNFLLLNVSSSAAQNMWQMGSLLPEGRLREPMSQALERADAVVFVKKTSGKGQSPASSTHLLLHDTPCLTFSLVASHFEDLSTREVLHLDSFRGKQGLAASAIASPEGFFLMLEELGLELKSKTAYRDHYEFSQNDWRKLTSTPEVPLFLTAKDAVKLLKFAPQRGQAYILMLKAVLQDSDQQTLDSLLLSVIK